MADRHGGDAEPVLPPSKYGAGYTVGGNDRTPNVAPPSYPPPASYPATSSPDFYPAGPPPALHYPDPAPVHAYSMPPAPQAWAARPATTNAMAIAGFVCSFFLAPLGIVFGHIALSQINRTGEGGRGLAIAGLVIGYVFTGLGLFWWFAILSIL